MRDHCEKIGASWFPNSSVVWHMEYPLRSVSITCLSSDELRRGGNHPTYSAPPLKWIVGRIVLAMARLIRQKIMAVITVMTNIIYNALSTVSFYQDESL